MITEQTSIFPLSFEQQRLWFFHQLEPQLPLYNVPIVHQLNGRLDRTALEQSLNDVVGHHEILRTTFEMVDGQPAQVIHPTLTIELPVVDLRPFSASEREQEIARWIEKEALAAFDLVNGPLLRARLLHSREEEYIFLLTVHHIIFDDSSVDILFRDLQACYKARKEGRLAALAELSIQYADYAVWQREWQEQASDSLLAYWKQQMKDAPAVLELPTDRPRPPVQTYQGDLYSFTLPPELAQALEELSKQEGSTLFMTLLAAFQLLLARYTEQRDIIVGSPIINRNRVEIESVIGFFVNMLALRTDLTGNPTFRQLLKRVRKVVLDAYAHLDLPFEKLVDGLQIPRDPSHTPLFQVMFALQNASTTSLQLSGLEVRQFEKTSKTARFDLSLIMITGKELSGVVEYNTDLFEKATIARVMEHFQNLLAGIVASPDLPVFRLPMVTATEREQLLQAINATAQDYPRETCFCQLFEAQVEKTPGSVAVVFEKQALTYRELNERANQLAHYLQRVGVGPEVPVGMYLERSLEMVIGLLGVLKAGGVYIPLDPAYPRERLAFILADARVPVLLTQQQLVPELPPHQARVICLDSDQELLARERSENPWSRATADNLAYIIYTSGSTGKPKGVMISQRALVNFLCFMRERLAITAQDRMLATTSLSFDIAGLELYLPLLAGASVILVSREAIVDGHQLVRAIDTSQATLMQMTPAGWRMLIEAGWQGYRKLRLLCGGEALSQELARALLTKGADLVNLYGPTETTIWSALHAVQHAESAIPLGQPIANTQIYILDALMQPVPPGVPGELYISGDGLARGYLNRPELSAERFVPHPFSEVPGTRLYRTGDLVRYRTHGSIEFLGRIDHQVKIRGFRIELGEIEAILREHQAIRDALVMVREDRPKHELLVAYLVAEQESILSAESLRDYLGTRLPGYMLPAAFVFLDAFPLTPNGKVDRQRFPIPTIRPSEVDKGYVAPRRLIEALLADIWAEVLAVEQIGVYDNLFDLGGDSIRCVQIATRVQQVGLAITPKQLLRYQTIDRLVNHLLARQQSAEQVEKIEHFLRAAEQS